MKKKKYKLTVKEPIFYSSRDGNIIRTAKMIGSTAIMHALGYKFSPNLEEKFVNIGKSFSEPNYEHLQNIGFYTTDAKPLNVKVNERTIRNTPYMAETGITIQADQTETDIEINEKYASSKGFPKTQHTSKATDHQIRQFLGISPTSELELTIWDFENIIPDNFSFRCGIDRSGFVSCSRDNNTSKKQTINKFLLDKFNAKNVILELIEDHTLVKRGDPRLHHFKEVPNSKFENKFIKTNKDKIKL